MVDEPNELAPAAEGRCPSCGADRPDLSTACPKCGAKPLGPAEAGRPATPGTERSRSPLEALMPVRSSDIEPYVGLGYLSTLFKIMAAILMLVLVAEVITGLASPMGFRAVLPTLLAEASRLIVLAGLLWGAGDLA